MIKSRYDFKLKIIAWIICIASACLISFSIMRLAQYDSDHTMTSDRYIESLEYLETMQAYTDSVEYAFYGYSEADKQQELQIYISELQNTYSAEISEVLSERELEGDYDKYFQSFQDAFAAKVSEYEAAEQSAEGKTLAEENRSQSDSVDVETIVENAELPDLDEYILKRVDSINEKYATLLVNAEEYIDEKYALKKQQAQDSLKTNTDYYYAIVSDGQTVYTNVPRELGDSVEVIQGLQANKDYLWDGATNGLYGKMMLNAEDPTTGESGRLTQASIYTGMANDFYEQGKRQYDMNYRGYLLVSVFLVVWIVLFAGAFAWLMYTAGQTPRHTAVTLTFMDAVWLDLGGVVLLIAELFLGILLYNTQVWNQGAVSVLQIVRVSFYTALATVFLLLWSMSAARRIKRKENYTLIGYVFRGFSRLWEKSTTKAKGIGMVLWYLIGGILLCLVTVLLGSLMGGTGVFIGIVLIAIYLAAVLKYILQKAAAVHDIAEGVRRIKEGEFSYRIARIGGGEFDEIAAGIEHIAEGFDTALTREVKSERMKTELITNVSHDIKTPLTSILTYVDLLKKEGLGSENAPHYLEVLDMKSRRLKYLTDDLFDAAKASSGDMAVSLTKIDLAEFMDQVMGELSDKIEESSLTFVLAEQKQRMFVYADGKLLFRVISNAIDNAIKYAAENSRVYIDFSENNGEACIVIKNVSRDALNMSEEELMERFKRGDESRHTEGSGLGLSIAKNFMELMKGKFRIEIDGDLFKVIICFPKETTCEKLEQETE